MEKERTFNVSRSVLQDLATADKEVVMRLRGGLELALESGSLVQYKLRIATSKSWFAGTNAPVSFRANTHSTLGAWTAIKASKHQLERGGVDEFDRLFLRDAPGIPTGGPRAPSFSSIDLINRGKDTWKVSCVALFPRDSAGLDQNNMVVYSCANKKSCTVKGGKPVRLERQAPGTKCGQQ